MMEFLLYIPARIKQCLNSLMLTMLESFCFPCNLGGPRVGQRLRITDPWFPAENSLPDAPQDPLLAQGQLSVHQKPQVLVTELLQLGRACSSPGRTCWAPPAQSSSQEPARWGVLHQPLILSHLPGVQGNVLHQPLTSCPDVQWNVLLSAPDLITFVSCPVPYQHQILSISCPAPPPSSESSSAGGSSRRFCWDVQLSRSSPAGTTPWKKFKFPFHRIREWTRLGKALIS